MLIFALTCLMVLATACSGLAWGEHVAARDHLGDFYGQAIMARIFTRAAVVFWALAAVVGVVWWNLK